MAVFHVHKLTCSCGETFNVEAADSVNAGRSPRLRQQVLDRTLHRFPCPACKVVHVVEKPFFYLDARRKMFFRVYPQGERHTWREASKRLDEASAVMPRKHMKGKRQLRVVFGLDELREKLVAKEAKVDDRNLELIKVLVMADHPVLMRRPRLRLTLDSMSTAGLEFDATYEHDPARFRITFPNSAYIKLLSKPLLPDWAATHKTSVFDLEDHWVNVWRWSPQTTSLSTLKSYASMIEAGADIDLESPEFEKTLAGLPRGEHLPRWAKRDLQKVFTYAKANGPQRLQDLIFEIRFGVDLEDDWSRNQNRDDIDTLWALLAALPDSNVEGNIKIRSINLDDGGGGTYDQQFHDIGIGRNELDGRGFASLVRHEVAHAVHEQKPEVVDAFLREEFGWQLFKPTNAGIDEWVGMMGGWGDLTGQQRTEVRNALREALGAGGKWKPGPRPTFPQGHPWNAADFEPRLACEASTENWFSKHAKWHRHGDKAFCLNFWYLRLMVVDVKTLELVKRLPDNYAAMSDSEFFAELYALYFDPDDEHYPSLSARVRKWFEENVGVAEEEEEEGETEPG